MFLRSARTRHIIPALSALSAFALLSKEPSKVVVRQESLDTADELPLSSLSPLPPLRILRPNPNLEICYDTRTRNAVYVQHRVVVPDDDSSKPTVHRRPRFFEEKSVEVAYRSKDSYFTASGYDRGHLAPAADFAFSSQQFQDTFNLCNASPQDKDLNRKLWAQLEDWTRRIAKKAARQGAVTYVTTGPVWLPRVRVQEKVYMYQVKGIGQPPTLVMVPSHFFKLVVVVDKDHSRITGHACFVVPNEASVNEKQVEDFIVSWSDLETVTGLVLFPGLADDTFKARANSLAHTVRPKEAPTSFLLTDGKKSYKNAGRSAKAFEHLCSDGACAFPKSSSK